MIADTSRPSVPVNRLLSVTSVLVSKFEEVTALIALIKRENIRHREATVSEIQKEFAVLTKVIETRLDAVKVSQEKKRTELEWRPTFRSVTISWNSTETRLSALCCCRCVDEVVGSVSKSAGAHPVGRLGPAFPSA